MQDNSAGFDLCWRNCKDKLGKLANRWGVYYDQGNAELAINNNAEAENMKSEETAPSVTGDTNLASETDNTSTNKPRADIAEDLSNDKKAGAGLE